MILFHRPSPAELGAYIDRQSRCDITYPGPNLIDDGRLPGFRQAHHHATIGHGTAAYKAAREHIEAWRPFSSSWLYLYSPAPSLEIGQTVAVVVSWGPFTLVNACRVVDVTESDRAYSFTYATLRDHLVCGIERFVVSRKPDGSVTYEITALFKSQHPLFWLGYPIVRMLQHHVGQTAVRTISARIPQPETKP